LPALKEPTRPSRGLPGGRPGHLFDPGGRRTLDDVISGLLAEGRDEAAVCPVCEEPALSRSPGGAFGCATCGIRIE
jgi:ribosomal protein L37AE/L43A